VTHRGPFQPLLFCDSVNPGENLSLDFSLFYYCWGSFLFYWVVWASGWSRSWPEAATARGAEPLERRSLSVCFPLVPAVAFVLTVCSVLSGERLGQDLRTNSCFFPLLWSRFGPGELPDLAGGTSPGAPSTRTAARSSLAKGKAAWPWPGWPLQGPWQRPGSCSVNRRGLCRALLSELSACFLLFELKFRYFFFQEQQDMFPLQKVVKVANTEREFGNYLYRKQHFEGAKDRYKRV